MADHADHGEYHRGEMDIHAQEATYRGFMRLQKWFCLHLTVVLTFFILLFCTKAGFLGALATAVILAVVGTAVLGDWKGKSGGH